MCQTPSLSISAGKPKPPSLLDLPLQVPTKMMDSKQQEESLPQQHMQPQEEVYNEEADYPQQEEGMTSFIKNIILWPFYDNDFYPHPSEITSNADIMASHCGI